MVAVIILVFTLIVYLSKVLGGFRGVQFSPAVSIIVVLLLAASLVWILVLTIQGRLIGRRVVFLYVGIAVSLPMKNVSPSASGCSPASIMPFTKSST